jgi:hypothetical protein
LKIQKFHFKTNILSYRVCSHTQRFFRGYKNITRPVRQSLPLLPLTLLCCVCVCAGQMAATTQQSAHTAVFFLISYLGKTFLCSPVQAAPCVTNVSTGNSSSSSSRNSSPGRNLGEQKVLSRRGERQGRGGRYGLR